MRQIIVKVHGRKGEAENHPHATNHRQSWGQEVKTIYASNSAAWKQAVVGRFLTSYTCTWSIKELLLLVGFASALSLPFCFSKPKLQSPQQQQPQQQQQKQQQQQQHNHNHYNNNKNDYHNFYNSNNIRNNKNNNNILLQTIVKVMGPRRSRKSSTLNSSQLINSAARHLPPAASATCGTCRLWHLPPVAIPPRIFRELA